MASFKDASGRTWQIAVNVGTIKRVKATLDVNLLDMVVGKLATELADDPIQLVDLLYVICKPEADAAGVSDEQFGASLVGDALDDATQALQQGVLDFFPAKKRTLLAKALLKQNQMMAKVLAKADAEINSPAMDQRLESLLSESWNGSGDALESSGSTPDPSH